MIFRLNVLSVCCYRDKRFQMVRELCALYQLLKDNSRRMSANMSTIIGKNVKPEKYIVGFHDAFR